MDVLSKSNVLIINQFLFDSTMAGWYSGDRRLFEAHWRHVVVVEQALVVGINLTLGVDLELVLVPLELTLPTLAMEMMLMPPGLAQHGVALELLE